MLTICIKKESHRKWTDKSAIAALVWSAWLAWAQCDIVILENVTELEMDPLEGIFSDYECVSISLCPTWLGIPCRRKRLFSAFVHHRSTLQVGPSPNLSWAR